MLPVYWYGSTTEHATLRVDQLGSQLAKVVFYTWYVSGTYLVGTGINSCFCALNSRIDLSFVRAAGFFD